MLDRAAARDRFRCAFLALIDCQTPDWHAVWCLFCEDPWCQCEREVVARRALNLVPVPGVRCDDVVSDMVLLLKRDLQHAPTLHYDRSRSSDCFGGWCGSVFRWLAKEALRAERRINPPHAVLVESHCLCDDCAALDRALDIEALIEKRSEPLRSVLRYLREGRTKVEIESLTGLSQAAIWRLLKEVRDELRPWLDGLED